MDTHLIAGVGKWSTETRTHPPPARKDKAKAPGWWEREVVKKTTCMDGLLSPISSGRPEDEIFLAGRTSTAGLIKVSQRSKIKNLQNFQQ